MTHEEVVAALTLAIDHGGIEGTANEFDEGQAEQLLAELLATYRPGPSDRQVELQQRLSTAQAAYAAAVASQPARVAVLVTQLSRSVRVLEGWLFDGLATRLLRYPTLEATVLDLDPSVPISDSAELRSRAAIVLSIHRQADQTVELLGLIRYGISPEPFASLQSGLDELEDIEGKMPSNAAVVSLQNQLSRLTQWNSGPYYDAKQRALRYLEYLSAAP